jgi:hypothetical protein
MPLVIGAWLTQILPNAHVVSRSNNRDVQGRMRACRKKFGRTRPGR